VVCKNTDLWLPNFLVRNFLHYHVQVLGILFLQICTQKQGKLKRHPVKIHTWIVPAQPKIFQIFTLENPFLYLVFLVDVLNQELLDKENHTLFDILR